MHGVVAVTATVAAALARAAASGNASRLSVSPETGQAPSLSPTQSPPKPIVSDLSLRPARPLKPRQVRRRACPVRADSPVLWYRSFKFRTVGPQDSYMIGIPSRPGDARLGIWELPSRIRVASVACEPERRGSESARRGKASNHMNRM